MFKIKGSASLMVLPSSLSHLSPTHLNMQNPSNHLKSKVIPQMFNRHRCWQLMQAMAFCFAFHHQHAAMIQHK